MARRARTIRAAGGLLGALLLLASTWREARGEDLIGYVEATAGSVSTTDVFPGSPRVDGDTHQVNERLNFTWNRRLWPRLTFWTGGTFDRGDVSTTVDGLPFDNQVTQVRPFVGLRRTGLRSSAQLLWNRDQRRLESGSFDPTRITRDGLFAAYTLAPRRGPTTRFSYTRTTEQDGAGTRDLASDLVDLSLVQRFGDRVRASYRGTYTTQEDAVVRSDARSLAHRGDVQYEDVWLQDRVWFHSEYAVARRDTTISSQGLGELVEPLFPLAGLGARDETPLDGALDPLPSLIDDDVTAATGIDLGLPGLGGDARPFGLGLDFGERTTVDALFVWVDRAIERASVAQFFTWRLYVSEDNQLWTPTLSLSAVPFDGFRRRFELRFPPLTARYVKLVVAPLTPEVLFADEFSDLFVTELSAGRRLLAPGTRVEDARTTQSLSLDGRARLLADRDFFYETSYYATDSTSQDMRWRASNGLSFVQPFAEVWTVSARAAHEQAHEGLRDTRALVYGSSLAVSPVPRLRWTLAFSGRQESGGLGLSIDQNSVFLYGSAGLYEGVDVQVGLGRSYLTDSAGRTTEATQLSLAATIVPRNDLSFGLSYLDSTSERLSEDVLGLFDLFTRAAEVSAGWTPFPTTYLYGAYRMEWRTDVDRDDVTNVVLSWSPFPLGSLRMGVSYTQTRRTLFERDERAYGPTLRWSLNPRSFVEVAYRSLRDDSLTQRSSNDIATATLRWGF